MPCAIRGLGRALCATLITLALLTSPAPMPTAVASLSLQPLHAVGDSASASRADPALRVRVKRIDAVVNEPDSSIVVIARIDNAGEEPVTGVVGTLVAHEALTSRFQLQRALEPTGHASGGGDQPLGAVLGQTIRNLGDIPPDATRFLAVTATADELGLPIEAEARSVHPLVLRVRTADGLIATHATAAIVMNGNPLRPLQTAVLMNVDADILTAAPALAGLAEVLETTAAPINLALDNAAAVANGQSQEMRRLLGQPTIHRAVTPYANADLVALRRGELDDLAFQALQRGAEPWPDTQVRADPAVLVPDLELDDATLERIARPFGVEAVVMNDTPMRTERAAAGETSPSPVRPLHYPGVSGAVSEQPMVGLIPDPWLTPAVNQDPQLGPQRVQRVLAETALTYLEQPEGQEQQGMVLPLPTAFPEGLGRLLTALTDASWVELTSLEDVRSTVAPGPPLHLDSDAARQEALDAGYVARIGAAHEQLLALAGTLPDDDPALTALRTELLLASSAKYRDRTAGGTALLDTVERSAGKVLGGVRVVGQPTVTFTDSGGQLPVVVRNNAGVALRVRIDLTSSRLRFPDTGRIVELEPQSVETLLFDTEARTPGGTAPVEVVITDPDGGQVLDRGTIIVRIAAYPLLALLLVAATALFLIAWWVRDLRRRRHPGPVPTHPPDDVPAHPPGHVPAHPPGHAPAHPPGKRA